MKKDKLRLMIKCHHDTNKKYLCVTSRSDYERYTGSGPAWRAHLKEHGYNFSTTVLFDTDTDHREAFNKRCRDMSAVLNIVESEEYLNAVIEDGYPSESSLSKSQETKDKIGAAHKGKEVTNYQRAIMVINRRRQEEQGILFTEEHREAIRKANRERDWTPEARARHKAGVDKAIKKRRHLKPKDVKEIRKLLAADALSQYRIAELYNTHQSIISHIKNNKRYVGVGV